jgi:myo-inositol 2-dehydrogenase/D-chiro-inositol 1-dehydrogenase
VTLRIGVIGCGRIGRMHAELVTRQVPGAALATVYDVVSEAAAGVSENLGVRAAASTDEVVTAADVDAVAICSPTETHVPLIEASAAAGKAIFCEKPLSLDLPEVDRALAAVEAAAVPFQVGFNRRFDPSHRVVRDRVAAGDVGDVHLVHITSRDPEPPPLEYLRTSGGMFLDQTIHDFDMARFVTGTEVVEVYARGLVRGNPAVAEMGDVDTAVVVMTHTDGVITTIDNSREAVYGYDQRVEAFGSRGMAVSENALTTTSVFRDENGGQVSKLPFFFLERYIPSYVAEWVAFVEMVTTGGPSPVGAADGRAPLVLGLAAWKSVREGRVVRVDEIDSRAKTRA